MGLTACEIGPLSPFAAMRGDVHSVLYVPAVDYEVYLPARVVPETATPRDAPTQ